MSKEANDEAKGVPVFLSFSNICTSAAGLKILQDVSGKVRPGEVMAIMGPSGSGKTTLLNVLAGRLAVDSGAVLINGKKLNKKLKRKICYVLQEDIFFSHLTLRETFVFSAMLRLPDTMSKRDKLQKVEDIVDTLAIRKCLDTMIGGQAERGLSGGEKKRANIGCELITNPSLIFLDEPTSGLDSSNAYNLMTTLKHIAITRQKTVVASIHQPSSQMFFMFDKLLLLCNGQIAYYGTPSDVIEFFQDIGMPCEEHYNPADFILEKVNSNKDVQQQIIASWSERRKTRKKSSTAIPATLHFETDVKRVGFTNVESSSSDDLGHKNPAFEMEQMGGDNTKEEEAENLTRKRNSNLQNCSQETTCNEETVRGVATTGIIHSEADKTSASDDAAHINLRDQEKRVPTTENGVTTGGALETQDKRQSTLLPDAEPHPSENGVRGVSFKQLTSAEDVGITHDDSESRDGNEVFGHISTVWVTSFWTQFIVLAQRNFKETKPAILSTLNLVQTLGLAVIVSMVWFRTPYKESSINDKYAMLFFLTTFWSFSPLFEALLIFPSERVVINKERSSGFYRLSAYYMAKTVSELPLVLFQPTVFMSIIYWTTGLNVSLAFLTTLFSVLISTLTAQAMGFCLGATVMDFKKSLVIAALFVMSCMLLGGFYQQNLPFWLHWAQYASFITYSFNAIVISEFTTSPPYTCNKLASAYEVCQNNGTLIQGTDVLQHFNVTRSYWANIAVLVAIMTFFRVLTYLVLRYIRRPK